LAVTFAALERLKIGFGEDYHPFWSLAALHNRDLIHDFRPCEPMRVDSLKCPSSALPALFSSLDAVQAQKQPPCFGVFYRDAKLRIRFAPMAVIGGLSSPVERSASQAYLGK
jgi:hypothetical protein